METCVFLPIHSHTYDDECVDVDVDVDDSLNTNTFKL